MTLGDSARLSTARAIMLGRILLQDEARRTPRLLLAMIDTLFLVRAVASA
jgi:hypothetical protein